MRENQSMPEGVYLDKKETQILKGLAVIAMICLHLFDRYDYSTFYSPILFLRGIPLTFYFGQLGDFCVMCLVFCTGYAHMTESQRIKTYAERLSGILVFLRTYWITIFVWILIGRFVVHTPELPRNMYELLGNLLCFHITMNGTWWYMYAYIGIVLLSPWLVKVVDRADWRQLWFIIIGTMYIASYIVRFKIDTNGFWGSKIGPWGMTMAEYLIGSWFYKYNIFGILTNITQNMMRGIKVIVSILLAIIALLSRTLIIQSLFLYHFQDS